MKIHKITPFLFFVFKLLISLSISAQNTIVTDTYKKTKDSTLIYLKKKQHLALRLNNKDSIIKSYIDLTNFQTFEQPKNTDTNELFWLLNYCKNNNDKNCRIRGYVMLARQMHKKEEYLQAVKYYNKAEELSIDYKKGITVWSLYINQAVLFNELLESEFARKKLKKSLEYIKEDEYHLRAITLLNIASTYDSNNPAAMVYFSKKTINLLKKTPKDESKKTLKVAANNMAYGYILQNKLLEASKIIETYIDTNIIAEDETFIFHTIGELNYRLKNYDRAIDYYKKSIQNSTNKSPITVISSLNDLAEVYEIKGDLKQSIYYLKAKNNYHQKITRNNLKKEIARSEINKRHIEKNKLITHLKNKNLKTNKQVYNSKIIALSSGILTVICILIFLTIYQKSRLKIAHLNEKISLIRLKSLRSIMNPHFLFNSFNTLQSFILQKNKFEASEHMRQLSHLIRKILSNSDSLYIHFAEELEIIKTYIALENKRFNDQFKLKLDIDENLSELNPKIPSMIIQPHLENAVVHGLSSKNIKILKLSFQQKKDSILCIIEDNGIGRRKSLELNKKFKNDVHLSIASRNTLERIKLLKKIGYKETSIKIIDLYDSSKIPNGTRIIINLPIINNHI
ncbi:tetratricopeptide repeat-containing sensor histidine kinase [Aquimarina longa]|uniref:tetratricopeptide repeat-containing sensor histidine kinase n=1 Tax=Aquimarina longa TaxID=1080221 RepID=UPI000783BC7B|nr:tetratricopeptide repeat protein [Aquimarina longa]